MLLEDVAEGMVVNHKHKRSQNGVLWHPLDKYRDLRVKDEQLHKVLLVHKIGHGSQHSKIKSRFAVANTNLESTPTGHLNSGGKTLEMPLI